MKGRIFFVVILIIVVTGLSIYITQFNNVEVSEEVQYLEGELLEVGFLVDDESNLENIDINDYSLENDGVVISFKDHEGKVDYITKDNYDSFEIIKSLPENKTPYVVYSFMKLSDSKGDNSIGFKSKHSFKAYISKDYPVGFFVKNKEKGEVD